MPLTHLLYRCPSCGHDPLEGRKDRAWCSSCGATFARGGQGGLIRVHEATGGDREERGTVLAARVDGKAPAEASGMDPALRRARVRVKRSGREGAVRYGGALLGFAEEVEDAGEGVLELSDGTLILRSARGGGTPLNQWALLDIRSVVTSSSAVQISPSTGGLIHFRFLDDSPRRWEELLHRSIRDAFRREGRGEILEFLPRIACRAPEGPAEAGSGGDPARSPEEGAQPGERGDGDRERGKGRLAAIPKDWNHKEPFLSSLNWYGWVKVLGKLFLLLVTRRRVRGLEHIPRKGPFIVVANHQSILDPIAVQVACSRPLYTLTKSTQFAGGFFRWMLPRLNAIPTRRYRIEPQAVRSVFRRLEEGRGVGIYPEGERSWDGALQPFRRGTIRLLLAAGVPVIPCGVSGTYDAWPRWSRSVRRRDVSVSFGPPLAIPTLASRGEREEALESTEKVVRRALMELGAWG